MTELVYCFGKLEKTVKVEDDFIIPSYGDKVNEFNESLIVRDVENKDNKIYITLKND